MKKRYTFSIVFTLLLISIICPGNLIAQSNGQVSGAVYESSTGSVLPGANIVIEGTTKGDAADRNGFFLVSNLAPGTYSITASFLGYEDGAQEIQIESGKTTKINFNLSETVIEGQDVVVYGNLSRGNAKALQDQKNAANIKNVVSSDLFQLFPDRNAAETAARIPGVSISYDQGEGEFVQIRGIGPEYNSLTVNGQRIPAPDPGAEGRSVGMDLLNQDLIENIIVTKASTPELDGDAIGGTINFEMMQAPDKGMLMLHAGGGYNVQHSDYDEYGKDIIDLAAIGGQRFLDGKLGVLVAGSYYKTNRGSTLREFEYDDVENSDDIEAQHSNDYDVKRERFGVNLNTEWKFDDLNKVYLNLNHNQYLDNEIRRSIEWVVEDNEEEKETRNRLEDQTVSTFMFGGKHNFNDIKVDYLGSWIKAQEDMPARTYFRFGRDIDLTQFTNDEIKDFGPASEFPGAEPHELNRIRVDDKLNEDTDIAGRLNIEVPFEFMDRTSTVKFGGKYLDKSSKFVEERLELKKFAEDHVLAEGEWGFEDVIVQPDDEDYLGATGVKHLDMSDDNYDAGETVISAYGLTNLNVNNRLSFLVGARFENTANRYKSLDSTSVNKEESDASYSNILPSLHATYHLDKNTNLRFAYSTGIARPTYNALVPYERRDDDEREISKGNPDLKPTNSNSFDVMYEKYTSNLGLLSGGVFYKKLSDIIVGTKVFETIDGEKYEVSMPINGDGEATVYGLELAVNQRLNILNVPLLKDFSLYANYTYTKSEAEVGGRSMPLSSSPENIVNLALMYDNPELGLSFVISNNFRDKILGSVGSDKYTDAWFDAEYHLDISATKAINEHLSVTLQLNNLTDQEEHEVFGDPSEDYSTIRQWAKFNSYGTLGITYRR